MAMLAPSCFGDGEPTRTSDVIRIAIQQPSSLDSATLRDYAGLLVAQQIYSPLVDIDPSTVQPRAGAARWEMFDGGTRFVFRLDAARFHDGGRVTAEDAAFALNRLVRRETSSDFAFLLADVVGFDEVYNRGMFPDLPGIRVLDPRTLEIQLSNPWVGFPWVLTHPATAPIPRASFEADPEGFRRKPIGSGPYRLAGPLETGEDFSLEAVGSQPLVRRVEFHVYEQSLRAWSDLESGLLDVAEAPPAEIRAARSRYRGEGFGPLAGMMYLGFNLANPKLQDVRFRQAVSLTLDRPTIARSVFGSTMRPATSLIPSRVAGFTRDPCADKCDHDPDEARSVIRESFPGGAPEFFFDFPESDVDLLLAESVQRSMAEIGVTVTPRSHEPTEFIEFVDAGSHELYRLGWVADYPSAEWFLYPLFATGRADNTTRFSSPETDGLLNQARVAAQARERFGLWREAEQKILEALPVTPIGQFESHLAIAPQVRGVRLSLLGTFDIAKISVLAP